MEKITSLVKKLQNRSLSIAHLTHLTLKKGEMFGWDHTACVISYQPSDEHAVAYLLHEFGHALCNHQTYSHDVSLLKMERKAWEVARTLAAEYDVVFSDDVAEDALDSYRDWLHNRSLCPSCNATGIQSGRNTYSCPACLGEWRVNEARSCALRRYTKKRPL